MNICKFIYTKNKKRTDQVQASSPLQNDDYYTTKLLTFLKHYSTRTKGELSNCHIEIGPHTPKVE